MMMEAAVNNRKAILKLLDSFGGDINATDRHDGTALTLRVATGTKRWPSTW